MRSVPSRDVDGRNVRDTRVGDVLWGTTGSLLVNTSRQIVIALDPGHGVRISPSSPIDPGAIRSRPSTSDVYEKDIALDYCQLLRASLQRKIDNVSVMLTREEDVPDMNVFHDYPNYPVPGKKHLYFRWMLADSRNADLMISIHCNASKSHTASYFRVIYATEDHLGNAMPGELVAKNIELGGKIISAVSLYPPDKKQLAIDDELKAINGSSVATVLVELGFITNDDDYRIITEQKMRFVEEIATGIMKYVMAHYEVRLLHNPALMQ